VKRRAGVVREGFEVEGAAVTGGNGGGAERERRDDRLFFFFFFALPLRPQTTHTKQTRARARDLFTTHAPIHAPN
jgi:hypothetical protein